LQRIVLSLAIGGPGTGVYCSYCHWSSGNLYIGLGVLLVISRVDFLATRNFLVAWLHRWNRNCAAGHAVEMGGSVASADRDEILRAMR
jgi:hypothetical protein